MNLISLTHKRIYPALMLHQVRLMFILLAFIVSPAKNTAHAQDAFIFDHMTIKDGLCSNFVNCIYQDRIGYLWIGSECGLQRYDGHQFSGIQGNGWEGLRQLSIHQIIDDKEGKVWIRSLNQVAILNLANSELKVVPIHFTQAGEDAANVTLQKDADGNVFVLTSTFNWYYFNKSSFSFEKRTFPFSIPGDWKVTSIHQDTRTRNFWITSVEKGIAMYDVRNKKMYTTDDNPINHPLLKEKKLSKYVLNLYIDKNDRYWISAWDSWPGGKNGQDFYCYSEKEKKFTADTSNIKIEAEKNNKYYQINNFIDFGDSGVVAYGTNVSLINRGKRFESFNRQDFDIYSFEYGIESNQVNQIYEDKEHTLWVATDNGLYSMPVMPQQNMHITFRDADVTSVLEGPSGNIWAGTWRKGVLGFDNWLNEDRPVDIYKNAPVGKQYKMVWALYQQKNAPKIWVACQEGRLIVYDTVTHRSTFLIPSIFQGRTIRTIAEDKEHNLWFCTQSGSVIKWNGSFSGKDSGFIKISQLENIVTKTIIDSHGWLWACTDSKGLFVIDTKSGRIIDHYSVESDPSHHIQVNKVNDIIQYNDSIYYLAADLLHKVNIKARTVELAYSNGSTWINTIQSLVVDNEKTIWLSTLHDIYKFNPSNQLYIHYGIGDGLISVINQRSILNFGYKLKNGHIILGGNDNLLYFNPVEYHNQKIPPDVVITNFVLGDKLLEIDSLMKLKTLDFNYRQNSLTINFASLSFTQRNRLTYSFMLKGADQSWRKTQNVLQASYNLLPPGEYTFMVRAQNEDGVFSGDITELHIVIHPPFWQTPWFIALEILACAVIIYYLYRMRINRLLHVERVRSRLARDLHDDMGSTLSTINILSNMAIKKLEKDTVATKDYITKISDNSSRIMEAMDDIVWSINPLNDTMPKVIARMKEFAGIVLEPKDIEYVFLVDDHVKDIAFDMESKREVYLIFKETMNNLAKYSNCTKVMVSMSLKKKIFTLRVVDNGVGFNPDAPELQSTQRGNGMRNMQKRAEHIHGKLKILSAPDQGATVELIIPIT